MISSFLDQQASLFVDTADQLAKMSRDTLMRARYVVYCDILCTNVLEINMYVIHLKEVKYRYTSAVRKSN